MLLKLLVWLSWKIYINLFLTFIIFIFVFFEQHFIYICLLFLLQLILKLGPTKLGKSPTVSIRLLWKHIIIVKIMSQINITKVIFSISLHHWFFRRTSNKRTIINEYSNIEWTWLDILGQSLDLFGYNRLKF